MTVTNDPLSTSRIPLNERAGPIFTGTPDELVAAPEPVKEMPVSMSTVAPAALRTVKVVELVDRLGPAPAVESKMVAVRVSSHEYMDLSTVIELWGNCCGPRTGAASARNTGPATRRA